MKEYSISKWAFVAICLLIISLPVARHWKILTSGEKAQGTVFDTVIHKKELLGGESRIYYTSEIVFQANGTPQKAYGPANYEYTIGRKVKVIYKKGNPSENCILTFSGFYLDGYTVLPIILLVVWAAFYMSFNNYQRKQRFKRYKYGAIPSAGKLTGAKTLSSKK